ncbi:hypothetical protein GJ496_001267 [Pomphorhynchus laevis]|nr:hypothetical protein GJ496_001267 [Pomphorhynchus laevis]
MRTSPSWCVFIICFISVLKSILSIVTTSRPNHDNESLITCLQVATLFSLAWLNCLYCDVFTFIDSLSHANIMPRFRILVYTTYSSVTVISLMVLCNVLCDVNESRNSTAGTIAQLDDEMYKLKYYIIHFLAPAIFLCEIDFIIFALSTTQKADTLMIQPLETNANCGLMSQIMNQTEYKMYKKMFSVFIFFLTGAYFLGLALSTQVIVNRMLISDFLLAIGSFAIYKFTSTCAKLYNVDQHSASIENIQPLDDKPSIIKQKFIINRNRLKLMWYTVRYRDILEMISLK